MPPLGVASKAYVDFWLAQAEILLSGLLFVAHAATGTWAAVCEWVLTQDRPGELGAGEVRRSTR